MADKIESGGDGSGSGLLAFVRGGDVKIDHIDLGTGLRGDRLPSSIPMFTTPVNDPAILSNALEQSHIEYKLYVDAGQPTFAVDTDKAGFWALIRGIAGL